MYLKVENSCFAHPSMNHMMMKADQFVYLTSKQNGAGIIGLNKLEHFDAKCYCGGHIRWYPSSENRVLTQFKKKM